MGNGTTQAADVDLDLDVDADMDADLMVLDLDAGIMPRRSALVTLAE